MSHPAAVSQGRYYHEAVFYRGVEDLVGQMVPFIRTGLEREEPVLVVLTADKLARLRQAMGNDGGRVQFADMLTVGRNPSTIIPAWRDFLDANPGRSVRGIGEPIYAARRPDELVEAKRHEALLNLAFDSAGSGFQLLCPYDETTLPTDVLESARRNHPHLGHDDARRPCGEYPGDDAVLSAHSGELAAPPPEAAQTAFDGRSLEAIRSLVARVANEARLSPERFSDLMLAASELAANSVRHAGGGGLARAWHTTDAVFCEVEDAGFIGDPLVGRRRPSLSAREGRGLWLVNHLCDLVEVRSAAGRTVVRVQVRS